jgi:hypothetical protein
MESIEVLPTVGPPSPEYMDEKASDTKEVISDTEFDVGEVCEDIRAIDMDADGKERPIGKLF